MAKQEVCDRPFCESCNIHHNGRCVPMKERPTIDAGWCYRHDCFHEVWDVIKGDSSGA